MTALWNRIHYKSEFGIQFSFFSQEWTHLCTSSGLESHEWGRSEEWDIWLRSILTLGQAVVPVGWVLTGGLFGEEVRQGAEEVQECWVLSVSLAMGRSSARGDILIY